MIHLIVTLLERFSLVLLFVLIRYETDCVVWTIKYNLV